MKRDFLETLGLEKEQIDKTLDQNSAEIGEKVKENEVLQTENKAYKKQLDEANKEIKSYQGMDVEGIKKASEEWKTKYETETQKLQGKLESERYSRIVEKKVQNVEFSSDSAKRTFIHDLKEKKLHVESEELLGFDDYLKGYGEKDPDAFKTGKPSPPGLADGAGTNPMLPGEQKGRFSESIAKLNEHRLIK